jgi:tetratricopeptide (TPR) repeat protein
LFSFFLRPSRKSARDYLTPLPGITEDVVRLTWRPAGRKFDLVVESAGYSHQPFRIDPNKFSGANSDALSDDIEHLTCKVFESFTQALKTPEHGHFERWWQQIASEHPRLFQLDFSAGPWDVPWELLLGLLVLDKTRERTSIVRCIGPTEATCASVPTEALRTLLVKADAPDLELDHTIRPILDAWDGLEHGLQEAVCKPEVINADHDTIVQRLRDLKPHTIWFVGHGSFDKTVQLSFSPKERVTAEQFAEDIEKAGHCPEFAVFWACDTAKGTTRIRSVGPELFKALSAKGVAAMLGMQSEVREHAAAVMASQLFKGLAQGLPLEWATARSRAWIYSIGGEKQLTMDWAAPVVWSGRRPVVHLQWNQSKLDHLQQQLIGTASIAKSQQGAALTVEPPDSDSCNRAQVWLSHPVTVVRGKQDSLEHRLWFLHTLKGVQTVSSQAVLVVEPERLMYSKQGLQEWAKGFLRSLEPGRISEQFLTRIDILRDDAESGWKRLCSLKDIFLAVIGPPSTSEDWFWIPLANRDGNFAVFTQEDLPLTFSGVQVNYAQAGEVVDQSQLADALQSHRKLLLNLSLMNIPVPDTTLAEFVYGKNAKEVFQQWKGLFLSTFCGHVIRADARDKILSEASEEALNQARLDCLELTERVGQGQKPYLKEFRIDLLITLGDMDKAAEELSDLLKLYEESGEQIHIPKVAAKCFKLRQALSPLEWLNIAREFLHYGDQRNASFWLRCQTKEPLDEPYKLGLKAEWKKNDGDISEARRLIDSAVQKCREIQDSADLDCNVRKKAERDSLDYRHDRARLLQFEEKNYEEATNEYRRIIKKIEDQSPQDLKSGLRHLLAVAHRNLGECLLSLDDMEEQDRRREATAHFHTAIAVAKDVFPFSPVIAETFYQLAKLAEVYGPLQDVRKYLEECLSAAEDSRHALMAILVKNKLLWFDVDQRGLLWDYVAERWNVIVEDLRAYRIHVWAARTLVDSMLRAVRKLWKLHRFNEARDYLMECLELFRENEKLRQGSDLRRIMVTLAGLQVISDWLRDGGQYWSLLQTEFKPAGKYASRMGFEDPKQTWEREQGYGNR